MTFIEFDNEQVSNAIRQSISASEPKSLRTFTPSQAVLSRSAGVFHWTPEGRKLYDYSSGVLVANLGHNPRRWMQRLFAYMGWPTASLDNGADYIEAVSLTAYNAITEIEAMASERLLASLQSSPGGSRLESVIWAASGSEAVQKALWACLNADKDRDIILATRHGFHGKKGLAGAVTGSEKDSDRDPRVQFISFPQEEITDLADVHESIDLTKYATELDAMKQRFGDRLCCLITEPYLGGGGSYHPPAAYHALLQAFCRDNNMAFVLDEVQSNFGRTGTMYAFEKYGIEPDFICLGKGLGNGIPVSAAVGRSDLCDKMNYGSTSDTWSANPVSCAAVLATLDEFETTDVLHNTARLNAVFVDGLNQLKSTGVIDKVRGEGMVFGIQCNALHNLSSADVAKLLVEVAYRGINDVGIHLLGPLAGDVVRVSPPMTMTMDEAHDSLRLLLQICESVAANINA